MTHFGIICPATTGHLNPMTALGWELQHRGHRVTLCGIMDAQPSTLAAGLEFRAIGESNFPRGAMSQIFEKQGKLSGFAAIAWFTSALIVAMTGQVSVATITPGVAESIYEFQNSR